jgi:DNA-binding MarR family transcriptional regulator
MDARTPPRPARQGEALRELAIVHQLVTTRLNRALRPIGITLTHASLLLHLSRTTGDSSVGEIAAAMEVNQPAVSKTLRALADRGAVTVDTPADNARRRSVRMTPAGRTLLAQAIAAMDPDATLTFADLDDRHLDDLVRLLRTVRERLDDARNG